MMLSQFFSSLSDNPLAIDAAWLIIIFFCGVLAKQVGLAPMVGFLLAGFIINMAGLQRGSVYSILEGLADIGVMILLFTIGLKLKIKSLIRKEIWLSATIHLVISTISIGGTLFLLSFLGLHMLAGMDWKSGLLVSFALSFSSTVFVVKTLESRGELSSYHGKIAIGILIIQDLFAVFFITVSEQKMPSLWILLLPVILYIFYQILHRLLDRLEHGEMIPIFGFFATFILGAFSFYMIGIKADLGALIMGMLLVNHPRSDELFTRMSEYKDFFLVAFFVNVGLVGLPTWDILWITLLIIPLLFVKGFFFLFILSKSPLQPRTAYLSALSLTNFSEFGLIISVFGMNQGWLADQWVIVMALLLSLSYIIASPLNAKSHRIFNRFKSFILRLNNETMTLDDEPENFGEAEIIVIGLGSVGVPTFKLLNRKFPNKVVGLDYDYDKIERMKGKNYNVLFADNTDSEFWENIDLSKVKAVFLTISDFASNLNILDEIKRLPQKNFKVFAIAHYPDQIATYKSYNVDYIYNYRQNLGFDFVDNVFINNLSLKDELLHP